MELMTVSAFDDWMAEVRSALESINMSIEDWQGIWPFDFQSEHAKGTAPAGAAEKANRFWWYQQNRSLKRDCLQTANCWLPRGHEGACHPVVKN